MRSFSARAMRNGRNAQSMKMLRMVLPSAKMTAFAERIPWMPRLIASRPRRLMPLFLLIQSRLSSLRLVVISFLSHGTLSALRNAPQAKMPSPAPATRLPVLDGVRIIRVLSILLVRLVNGRDRERCRSHYEQQLVDQRHIFTSARMVRPFGQIRFKPRRIA